MVLSPALGFMVPHKFIRQPDLTVTLTPGTPLFSTSGTPARPGPSRMTTPSGSAPPLSSDDQEEDEADISSHHQSHAEVRGWQTQHWLLPPITLPPNWPYWDPWAICRAQNLRPSNPPRSRRTRPLCQWTQHSLRHRVKRLKNLRMHLKVIHCCPHIFRLRVWMK